VNVAALVAYDGTPFAGFQRQSPDKGPTVQGAIEEAIQRIAGVATTIEGAGRTDSGVHAAGQVISFQTSARLTPPDWQRALNALLPRAIAVRAARAVDDGFRARHSALARGYRYRVLCDATRDPLRERYAWRVARRLDVPAMRDAARSLLGEHDFAAFGSSPHDGRGDGFHGHTVRTMLAAACEQRPICPGALAAGAAGESGAEPDGAELEGAAVAVEFHFTANAFLSGMVRRLVGTLALVGAGRLTVADFQAILAARDKAHPGAAAPACGLCLTHVAYPPGSVTW
jgi:tRNA pseudouridine38-40 synthase